MKFLLDLKNRKFDRIIFNFPHAGFYGKEDNMEVIEKHKDLVLGFFKNASRMLRANGEIHVNHKTSGPFNDWDIKSLGAQSSLTLIELADFKKEDYPGYNNKRGDSYRCDEPFPLGKCSTFKFIFNPRATVRKCKMKKKKVSGEQIRLGFQEIQDAGKRLPTTSIDLNNYSQSSGISKLERIAASLYGVSNEHAQIPGGYLSIVNGEHHRAVPFDGYYFGHGMIQSSQRLLQPLQLMQQLNSSQPWPTSTNVGYSQTNYVTTTDINPPPLGPRNEGYQSQVYRGGLNYMREAADIAIQSYQWEGVKRPEFQSKISELHWKEVLKL
ncbi:hypothetical protein PIB30_038349 [Stylosanthes scabra]|uniref:25S rRNA (uridine-N(3))-methyltransferase BMT5-like domain-containing protein n=1 Tax=Stylosanthes scabra TaxID=79078 RepID=A0ABU6YFY5_9FABA|nr:hypothetical protein [Stylosanthes scabra]